MTLPEYNNDAIIEAIVVRIHKIRDRRIMYDRLVHGLTYEQLAEAHDMSVSQIKRIVKKHLRVIFD